jgi:hypothetical protein
MAIIVRSYHNEQEMNANRTSFTCSCFHMIHLENTDWILVSFGMGIMPLDATPNLY